MNDAVQFRVVAVRDGGDRLVVSDRMSLDLANRLRERLLAASAFPEVLVEPDSDGDPDGGDGEGRETITL